MKKAFVKAVALAAIVTFGSANISFAVGGSIGHGNLSVYKSGELVSKLTGQNPVEDGALLVCDGKCMIKSEGISLVADDKSKVAVTNEANTFKLFVSEGKVDYVITSNARTISFYTPQGTYTVAEVVFNAGSQSVVKGSIEVDSDGKTEISVTEGRMVFATAEGMKTVSANDKIILAVAPNNDSGFSNTTLLLGGAAVLGAGVLGYVIYKNNDDDDDDTPAGPGSTPDTGSTPPATQPSPGTGGKKDTPASPSN